MLSGKVEQRVNVKFLAKLGKFTIETNSLLKKVYGDECLSHTQVFKWFKRFKEGRGEIEEQVKFQSNDDRFFFISKGLFTLIGCLKVRSLTRSTVRRFWQSFVNRWKEKDLKCGRRAHRFFTMTTHWHKRTVCQDVCGVAQDPHVGTSTLLTWPSPMWFFPPLQRSSLH
jgi:hypothetical protein